MITMPQIPQIQATDDKPLVLTTCPHVDLLAVILDRVPSATAHTLATFLVTPFPGAIKIKYSDETCSASGSIEIGRDTAHARVITTSLHTIDVFVWDTKDEQCVIIRLGNDPSRTFYRDVKEAINRFGGSIATVRRYPPEELDDPPIVFPIRIEGGE